MSNLMAMLNTGVSGIWAAQAKIDITGHNIANIDNPDYSKQRVNVAASSVSQARYGTFGRGVEVKEVIRVYDDLLARTVRNENSGKSYWQTSSMIAEKFKLYFNELQKSSATIGDGLKSYYAAWQDLHNTAPDKTDESMIKRTQVLESANTLAKTIRDTHGMFEESRNEIDERLNGYVGDINLMTKQIAELNGKIQRIEMGGNGENANDLRDARDAILLSMGKMVEITAVERDMGDVAVFIGGTLLVDGTDQFDLETRDNEDGHLDIYRVIKDWYDTGFNITDIISGGAMRAELDMRDEVIPGYMDELDALARTLIEETNKVHASGQGLQRYNQLESSNTAVNPGYPVGMQEGAFPYDIRSGAFEIHVYDAKGDIVDTFNIHIDPSVDTLHGIAEKISLADGDLGGGNISASVTGDGTLRITADTGHTFAFGKDTSNFVVASGFNNFFVGTDAASIGIDRHVSDNPQYISTSTGGAPGDNEIARTMVEDVQFSRIAGGEMTIGEFYGYFSGKIATDKQQIDIFYASKTLTVNQFELQLQSVKGVTMEEEQTNLIMFQRVLEANSRFINAVDELLDLIVNRLGLVGR